MEYDVKLDDTIVKELSKNSNLKRSYNELYKLVNNNYFKKKKSNINKNGNLSSSTFSFHIQKLLSENIIEKNDTGKRGVNVYYSLSEKTLTEIKYKIFENKSKREQNKTKESYTENYKKLYLLLLLSSFPKERRYNPSKTLSEIEFKQFLSELNLQEENLQIVNEIIYDPHSHLAPTQDQWNDYGEDLTPMLFKESLLHLLKRKYLWEILEDKIKTKEVTRDEIYVRYRDITYETFDRFQIEKRFYKLSKKISSTPFYYTEYILYNKGFIFEDLLEKKRRMFFESIGLTADEIKEIIKIGLEEKIIIPSKFIDDRYIIFNKELEKYLESCAKFVYVILDTITTLSKYVKLSKQEKNYLEFFKGKVDSNKIIIENYEFRKRGNLSLEEQVLYSIELELDKLTFQNYLNLTLPSLNDGLVKKYKFPLDIILEVIYPRLIQQSINNKIRKVIDKIDLEIQKYYKSKK